MDNYIVVRFSNSSLSSGNSDYYDLYNANLKDDNGIVANDYAPYKNIKFINTGNSLIELKLNNNLSGFIVPAGTILDLEGEQIRAVEVKNIGANDAEYYFTLDNRESVKSLLNKVKI